MSLNIDTVVVGSIYTNCYVLTLNDEAAVVDPGEYTTELENLLKKRGVTELKYILLTHAHFDHIDGVAELQRNFGGKIVISRKGNEALQNPMLVRGYTNTERIKKAGIIVDEGSGLPFGGRTVKVIATPGHTAGSVCYSIENIMFSGDTLFAGSMGRTDFEDGNDLDMINSLKRLKSLEGDYYVYPGHGPATTLGEERKNNPFLRRL